MKNTLSFLAFFLLISFASTAQITTSKIKGTVTDKKHYNDVEDLELPKVKKQASNRSNTNENTQ